MSFFAYVVRRVVLSAVAAFLVVSLTFVVVATNQFEAVNPTPAPGGPPGSSAADPTLVQQYVDHVVGVLQFDWGYSVALQRPVGAVLADAVPRTLAYAVPAILLAYAVGTLAGVVAAYSGRRRDAVVRVAAYATLGVPTMVVGTIVATGLAGEFAWLSHPAWCYRGGLGMRCPIPFVSGGQPFLGPISWREGVFPIWPRPHWPNTLPWRHVSVKYVLPAAVLAVGLLASLFRHARNAALAHRNSPQAKMLRAKGADDVTDARHALRNAALPLLSVSFAELMSVLALWAFVVEAIFHVPGITAYVQIAVRLRDLPLLVGTTSVLAFVGIGLNLVQDVLYAYLDPQFDE